MKANGESKLGKMKEGQTFINMFVDMNLYYVRGEYNRRLKRYYCRAYYRSTHIRWELKDRKWPSNKKVIKYKLE